MNGVERVTFAASSHVAGAEFDPATDTLTLTFTDGDSYDYFNVPPATFRALCSSASQGAFFYRSIKNRFAFDGPK